MITNEENRYLNTYKRKKQNRIKLTNDTSKKKPITRIKEYIGNKIFTEKMKIILNDPEFLNKKKMRMKILMVIKQHI